MKESTKQLTPEQLFKYADHYARRSERNGRGTQYPTLRQAAKRFGVRIDDVVQACDDWDSSGGYMQVAVGFSCGSGIATFNSKGDCLVEAYEDKHCPI